MYQLKKGMLFIKDGHRKPDKVTVERDDRGE